MIEYMRVLPLRCPKCKKVILHMLSKITKNGNYYHKCPECTYFSKTSEKFVDKKAIRAEEKAIRKTYSNVEKNNDFRNSRA